MAHALNALHGCPAPAKLFRNDSHIRVINFNRNFLKWFGKLTILSKVEGLII